METEKVVLAEIYKKDKLINIEFTGDTLDYEIYGFLKCFVKRMEDSLIDSMENVE